MVEKRGASAGAKAGNESSYLQNRELSWLRFDERVLNEALDETVPLYERLKFIAIFTSNLDEFFMVRAGSLTDLELVAPETRDDKTHMTPGEQLEAIYTRARELMQKRDEVYAQISDLLRAQGVNHRKYGELSEAERAEIDESFDANVAPLLSPQVVDGVHPFPHLENKRLYVVARVATEAERHHIALVALPQAAPSLLFSASDETWFVRTEDMLCARFAELFPLCETGAASCICITRNADIKLGERFDDEENDARSAMVGLLKQRARLNPLRLEVQNAIDPILLESLLAKLNLKPHQVFIETAPLDMSSVYSFENRLPVTFRRKALYKPYTPRWPKSIDQSKPVLQQVLEGEKLLYFPYDSIEPFLRLIEEASVDAAVTSIRITLYRLASESRIAEALARAAENGKEVLVLMELRARFDEERNIWWSRYLEDAGCYVFYGPEGYKCHSKVCSITRVENDVITHVTQIGTGNYNEKTSRVYTDISLLTANQVIGNDAVSFFRNMMTGNLEGSYDKLVVAPANMLSTLLESIERETAKGKEGRIWLKANSLTERRVIEALVRASQAGVEVRLNIRGICCLKPGVTGYTDCIQARSIVGRYLEHARIYCFGKGDDMKLLMGSADLMTRNLRRRVEVLCPIEDELMRQSLLGYFHLIFEDNAKARLLMPDGRYIAPVPGKERISLHDRCMQERLQPVVTCEASAKPADGVVVAEAPAKRGLFARLKTFFSGR